MKKYVLLWVLLILCLLSGCEAAPIQPPTPVYDETPTLTEQNIFFDGIKLSYYSSNDTGYIRLDDLTGAMEGTINTPEDNAAPYFCSFSLQGQLYHLSTDSQSLTTETEDIDLGCTPLFDGESWFLPYESLPLLNSKDYHLFEDAEQKALYYTAYPTSEQVKEGVRLPILMYHAVGDEPWGIADLFVSPSSLEKQLLYLQENGYTTITFEDMDRLHEIEKPVMLTFDDGYDDNYTLLLPLLKKYNAKATVFVITGEIGNKYYLTEEQIKEMSDSGLISIQSHTVTHPFLSDLGEEQLESELLDSKKTLARITGKEPFVLCYPTGKHSSLSREKTAEHYQFGLLMNGGTWTTDSDIFRIPRSYISRSTSLSSFADKL